MELHVLGSGSSGNCYLLKSSTGYLVIEAGVKFLEVKKAINFDLSNIVACIVSHEHNDHAKYLKDFVDSGIKCLALNEVFAAKGIDVSSGFVKTIRVGGAYKVGEFKIIVFQAFHDVPCVGFVVNHPESGTILFLTDSYTCGNTFRGLSHILIECNFSDSILSDNVEKGIVPKVLQSRLYQSHMGLYACKEVLNNNDLTDIRNIVLIHLSNDNSHERQFVEEVQRSTGKPVYAAKEGLILNLDKLAY